MKFTWMNSNKKRQQFWLSTLLAASTTNLFGMVQAQPKPDLTFLDQPVPAYNYTGTQGHSILNNNGVFLTPDGDMAVVLTVDCLIHGFDPATGAQKEAQQQRNGNCYGGVFFAPDYIAFSVVDKDNATSKIVGHRYSNLRQSFATESFNGVAVGTPVATSDGKYVMTTANTDGGVAGTFIVFEVGGDKVFQTDTTEPVSALGYYHNPLQGYYDGGLDNTNDVAIWGHDNEPSNPAVGEGKMFAFQFPMANSTDQSLSVTVLGEAIGVTARGYQSALPPVIANGGLNMYWLVSRSRLRWWIGTFDRLRDSFDTSPLRADFTEGDPRSKYAKAPPALSSDDSAPILYGPTAVESIFTTAGTAGTDGSGRPLFLTKATAGVICSRMVVSPDDARVYYATQAPDSQLYSLNAGNLNQFWEVPAGSSGILGDLALSQYGDYVMAPGADGVVYGYKVADFSFPPTPPPSMAVSEEPTMMPSSIPSDQPSNAPSPAPSDSASAAPSPAPSPAPSGSPTFPPTGQPSVIPTPFPSPMPTIDMSAAPTTTAKPTTKTPAPTVPTTPMPTSAAPTTEVPTGMPNALPTPPPTKSTGPTDPPTVSPTTAPTKMDVVNTPPPVTPDPTPAPVEPPTPDPTNAPITPVITLEPVPDSSSAFLSLRLAMTVSSSLLLAGLLIWAA